MMPFRAWQLPTALPEPAGRSTVAAGSEAGQVEYAELSADEARTLCRVLREAREAALLPRSAREIARVLGRVGRRFLDPGDRVRRRAMAFLPALSGLSAPMAAEVLDGMARDWLPDRLAALLAAEFGDPDVLDGFRPGPAGGRVRALGFPLTVHVGAGNVPGVSVTSLIRGLLVKSAVLVKPGRNDVVLPTLFAGALREEDPSLAGAAAVCYWPGGGGGAEDMILGEADAVVVYGGRETVRSVAERVPVTTRVVAYPHRISLGMVAREALGSTELPRVAAAAARAVAVFDQRGCVSPHLLYVEEDGEVAPRAFATELARRMAEIEDELPSGPVLPDEAAAVHQVRGAAELQAAASGGVEVHREDGSLWTVIYDPEPSFEASCLGRVVRVKPVARLEDAVAALADVSPWLQTVALEAPAHRLDALAEALARAGVVRLSSLRATPWPPPWWHHDGRGPLRALVRWTDLEEGVGRSSVRS